MATRPFHAPPKVCARRPGQVKFLPICCCDNSQTDGRVVKADAASKSASQAMPRDPVLGPDDRDHPLVGALALERHEEDPLVLAQV
jgi:hypothetical protein